MWTTFSRDTPDEALSACRGAPEIAHSARSTDHSAMPASLLGAPPGRVAPGLSGITENVNARNVGLGSTSDPRSL
jgi:hypothetical protein